MDALFRSMKTGVQEAQKQRRLENDSSGGSSTLVDERDHEKN